MRRITIAALAFLALLPVLALAQSLIPPGGTIGSCSFITGEFDFECIPLYVGYLIKIVFGFTGGFAMTEILKSGYEIAFSGLTQDKEKGKNRLRWALIGLAVSILAFLIVDFAISALILGP